MIDLPGSVAMYNDKGFIWRHDSPEAIAQFRRDAQASIVTLIAEIGEARFPATLLAALKDGRAADDASGRFEEAARQCFGMARER